MKVKYRIKLNTGRIIGPLDGDQIIELFEKGHIRGNEIIQTFPAGDWLDLSDVSEVYEPIKKLALGIKEKTKINEPIPEVTNSFQTETVHIKETTEEKNAGNEFVFEKPEIGKHIDVKKREPSINLEDLVDEDDSEEVEDVDATVVKKLVNPSNVEKTKIVHREELEDLKVEKKDKNETVELKMDKEIKKELNVPVPVDKDAETEMIDISNFKNEIAVVAKEAEKEFKEAVKEETFVEKTMVFVKENKRKMSPVMAIVFVLLLGYLFLDDEGEKQTGPLFAEIKFPILKEYENAALARELYSDALKAYETGTYQGKVLASIKFRTSLQNKFKNNPSLPHLIKVYGELLGETKNKNKSANTLYKLIKIGRGKVIKDINIAIGTSLFYYHQKKYDAAINTIENYLRFSKPSLKLLAYYLKFTVEAGDFIKAQKVVDTLLKQDRFTLEGYLYLFDWYKTNQELDKAEKILLEGGKKYSSSVELLAAFTKFHFERNDLKKALQSLKAINELQSDRKPSIYAFYFEYLGVLSALQKKNEIAAGYFKASLKIKESDQLRAKLAELEVSGSTNVQYLIKESKIKDSMNKAKEAAEKKDWEKAFLHAIDAVDISKDYIPSAILLAKIQTKRGFYQRAIDTLAELRSKFPMNPVVIFQQIYTLIEARRFRDAQQELASISTTKYKESYIYKSLLGRMYYAQNKFTLAATWIQRSINQNPINDDDIFLMAQMFLKLRQYKKAKKYIGDAIELDPSNLDYKVLSAKIIYELDGADPAIGYLKSLEDESKADPYILGEIAIYYYRSGQNKEFDIYVKKIEEVGLANKSFYRFLIKNSELEDRYKDVVNYSETLLKIDPGDIETRMKLGSFYYNQKKYRQALDQFEKVKVRLESHPKLHYEISRTYLAMGDFQKALENAEKEIEFNKSLEGGYIALGQAYTKLEKYLEATKAFEKALAINPSSVEGLKSLGWIKKRQGYLSEAVALYGRAINESPNDGDGRREIGFIYKEIGQSGLAIEAFKVYLELVPNAPDKGSIESIIKNLR